MYVMGSEPIPSTSASDIKEYFKDKTTVQELADAFAITSNKFWWVEDNEYDYEEGTPEYIEASAITHEWCELMKSYENKFFERTFHTFPRLTVIVSKGLHRQEGFCIKR